MRSPAPPIESIRKRRGIAVCLLGLALVAGCREEEVGYTEVKRIPEVLTVRDVADLVAVLKAVGEKDRGVVPQPFLPPPRWAADRTLPVRELLSEERFAAGQAWIPEEAAAGLPATPTWEKALRARRLTRAQFASLVLSAAASIGRFQADPGLDLPKLAARGLREVRPLADEERTFASLAPDERHSVLRRATWVTTAERAARLAEVPPENVDLMRQREAEFRELLPGFFNDPFGGLYPRAEDFGVPFDEGSLSDADLAWSPEHAILGADPVDATTAANPAGRH